jgi:exodeoxyribonuclease VII large subunit
VVLFPVVVQGEGAGAQIAKALAALSREGEPAFDVIVITRGGGSAEDLSCFNDEGLARAIRAARFPVVSAVGHEVDFTIADFVADLRAATPSAAAELVIGNKVDLINRLDQLLRRMLQVERKLQMIEMQVDDLFQRLVRSVENKLSDFELTLEKLNGKLFRFSPVAVLAHQRQRIEHILSKLIAFPSAYFMSRHQQIKLLAEKLRLLNPRTIMNRGYSIVRVMDTQKVVTKVADVAMGQKLLIELSKGRITAKVQ